MRHIKSKAEFYTYSRKLLLGNRLTQWAWEEFDKLYKETPEVLPKIVGVRHVRKAFTNKGNSGLMKRDDAWKYGCDTPDKENLLFDEGAVHDHLTIQGEVMATERGLYLRYSHLQCHQRTLWHIDQYGVKDLKTFQRPHNPEILNARQIDGLEGVVKHEFGLRASAILQKYMDDRSWDVLNEILGCQIGETNTRGSEFPNFQHPVIEFAVFSDSVGILGWNTIFWEIRNLY